MATGLVVVSGLLTGTASAESSSIPREAAPEARIKELKNRIMLLERRLTGAGVKACGAPEPSRSVRVARPRQKFEASPPPRGRPPLPNRRPSPPLRRSRQHRRRPGTGHIAPAGLIRMAVSLGACGRRGPVIATDHEKAGVYVKKPCFMNRAVVASPPVSALILLSAHRGPLPSPAK
jgi:hypothetical protein